MVQTSRIILIRHCFKFAGKRSSDIWNVCVSVLFLCQFQFLKQEEVWWRQAGAYRRRAISVIWCCARNPFTHAAVAVHYRGKVQLAWLAKFGRSISWISVTLLLNLKQNLIFILCFMTHCTYNFQFAAIAWTNTYRKIVKFTWDWEKYNAKVSVRRASFSKGKEFTLLGGPSLYIQEIENELLNACEPLNKLRAIIYIYIIYKIVSLLI